MGLGELITKETHLFKLVREVDVNILIVKNFFSYLDYYLSTLKVIITLVGRGKLANIRAILNTRAEVSIISLNIALRFEIPITYSTRIFL